MTRTITCADCGAPFTAHSPRATYCGATCRSRARHRRQRDPQGIATALPMDTAPGDLARAVERDLDTYGARDTTAGQTALALARRIDDGPESATGLAALSRELRATMTETLSAHANTSGGFLVELQTRRDQRRQALT